MNPHVAPALILAIPLLLGGCDAVVSTAAKSPDANRPTGMWQKTTFSVQKYPHALFREKKTGKVLDPRDAGNLPEAEVTLEAGDFEELTYTNGRLRYAFFSRLAKVQPFVVERAATESEFEEFDKALYADKFFGMAEKNWANDRFPLYDVRYEQNGKGAKSSFTPNLNRLLKFGPLLTTQLGLFSGETPLPSGVQQHAYYMATEGGQLKVSVSTIVGTNGEAEDRPWKFKSASYDTGKGFQSATINAQGDAFTLPAPTGDGTYQLMGLKLVTEGNGPGTWDTLVPVRTSK